MFKNTLTAAALTIAAFAAQAAAITPTFTSFGTLSGATFGGTGIANDAVAITQFNNPAGAAVTLGLTAHQRYSNPAVTHNNAGVFTAQAGTDLNPPAPGDTGPYGLWNFAFYVGGAGAGTLGYRLYYDFSPAAGNDANTHGVIDVSQLPGVPYQDSWNLGMDFLEVSSFSITPPAGSFDPEAVGQYTFRIEAYLRESGALVDGGAVAMQVNVVGQEVPEPGSLALVGAALIGLAAARRRKV